MPLPKPWVDRLFAKLTLTYGHRFLGMYSGLDLEAVKADWANELHGLDARPEAIRHALEHLPVDNPPTVLQFRALCRNAPGPAFKALPQPDGVKPNPEVLAKVAEAVRKPDHLDGKAWAYRLAEREHYQDTHPRDVSGHERLTLAQRSMWRAALGVETSTRAATVLERAGRLQAA